MPVSLLVLLGLALPAEAAKIKVPVFNPEHTCTGLLDTAKMSKREFEKVSALYSFVSSPMNLDPLGFLGTKEQVKQTRAEINQNLEFIESSVKTIPSFRQAKWKKLGAFLVARARAGREKQLAALAFMDTWDPAPLLDEDNYEGLQESPHLEYVPNESPRDREKRQKEAEKKILQQPLEERDPMYLTCNQRLRLIADDSKLEKFSPVFAKYTCANNGDPKRCESDYIITKEMPKDKREGRRMQLFQWAWYNNGACTFTRAKLPAAEYDEYQNPKVEDLMHLAITDEQCESECED